MPSVTGCGLATKLDIDSPPVVEQNCRHLVVRIYEAMLARQQYKGSIPPSRSRDGFLHAMQRCRSTGKFLIVIDLSANCRTRVVRCSNELGLQILATNAKRGLPHSNGRGELTRLSLSKSEHTNNKSMAGIPCRMQDNAELKNTSSCLSHRQSAETPSP